MYINYNFHAHMQRDRILLGALRGRHHVPYSLGRELIIGGDSPARRKQLRSNVYIRPSSADNINRLGAIVSRKVVLRRLV